MEYFLNLFSPETWSAFRAAGRTISGFSRHQKTHAQRSLQPGNIFLCYLVGLGRWCGALEIESEAFVDEAPIFKPVSDPFVVRFRVTPLVVLAPEHALPMREPSLWNRLAWTKDKSPGAVGWGANFQRSLRRMPEEDGAFLLDLLTKQAQTLKPYELSGKDRRALNRATVRTATGELPVEIPDGDDETEGLAEDRVKELEVRQSHKIQAMIAEIGSKMGFKIWLPKSDRERVKTATSYDLNATIIEILPMNYNDATIRTIEQIDVIWLKGRSIARAFEIEHTTAIYSGLLRMADLVALQPDIDIPLHIVAPESRQSAVLDQIKRPVFSLLETGPLSDRCSLLTYDDIEEIAAKPDLAHMRDSILDDYQVFAH
ncbi:MAG TPA: hypothetical protein PK264_23650 [Hyphomicrobiaceae bacterium]|nr:hypothetical protein [Hyphomicrobiaceae bacterium]